MENEALERADRPQDGRRPVVLFDGLCNLCNGWVRFVVKRDPSARFRFAPLQSEFAQRAVPDAESLKGLDSIVLLEDGRVFVRSTAVLRILRRLRPPWPLLSAFLVVPKALRDAVYDFVARKRYRWFGRRDACMVPSAEVRDRFLG